MPEERAKLTMHGLVSATNRLRRDVMQRIHIKEMPTLQLIYDEGQKAEQEVFALLERDRQEREARNQSKAETNQVEATDERAEMSDHVDTTGAEDL